MPHTKRIDCGPPERGRSLLVESPEMQPIDDRSASLISRPQPSLLNGSVKLEA